MNDCNVPETLKQLGIVCVNKKADFVHFELPNRDEMNKNDLFVHLTSIFRRFIRMRG